MQTTSHAPTQRPARGLQMFALVTILACAADLAAKWLAVRGLGGTQVDIVSGLLSLVVVYNQGVTGGTTIGPYTWQANVVVTMFAIGLIVAVAPALSAVDRRAAWALGLVAGGALGNLASMIGGPAGVADFLAVHTGRGTLIIMNVADLALWTGALMLLPVAATLLQAIRLEGRTKRALLAR